MDASDSLKGRRIVVASNRLPIVVQGRGDSACVAPAAGGLVTALVPILKKMKGVWLGWPGDAECPEEEVRLLLERFAAKEGYQLRPLFLTDEEVHLYYDGFSNEIIWPLFHDLHTNCNFAPEYWEGYKQVNRKFAREILNLYGKDDYIWIQDYHLILVAQELRSMGVETELNFFLHVPFASLDIFSKIPWREELLEAMLHFDRLGFQTDRDYRNFILCVETLLDGALCTPHDGGGSICHYKGREIAINAFPISIDYKEYNNEAHSNGVAAEVLHIREMLPDRKIVLSVDRLDYTKGVIQRLEAIRAFLEAHPEMHEKVTFVQQMVPSRTQIPEYLDLKAHVDKIVSEINSRYTTLGWVPIHYMFHAIAREQLIAYYRTADVLLINSIKDGMNLVAKEFVACNVDESGVLVLSEFAGAARQLGEQALLINPYDITAVANALHAALTMAPSEKRRRMSLLRKAVEREDIHRWIDAVLQSLSTI